MAETRAEWANGLRGLAAVTVVISHFALAFWTQPRGVDALLHVPYTGVVNQPKASPGFAQFLDKLPVDVGGFGIALFFVLSGFVIGLSLQKYNRPAFAMSRLMRIIPTYAVGFLVAVLTVALSVWLVDGSGSAPTWGASAVGLIPGLPVLFGVDAVNPGIDWTLTIELIFYAICLAGGRRIVRSWLGPMVVAAGCVAVQFSLNTPSQAVHIPGPLAGSTYLLLRAMPFMPLLLVGVVVSSMRRCGVEFLKTFHVVALLAVNQWLMATSTTVPTAVKYQRTMVIAASVFLLFWLMASRWQPGRLLGFLSKISYSLYVSHAIAGYGLLRILESRDWPPLLAVLVAFYCALGLATLIYYGVELPTHRYGRRCAKRAIHNAVERKTLPYTPSTCAVTSAPPQQAAALVDAAAAIVA